MAGCATVVVVREGMGGGAVGGGWRRAGTGRRWGGSWDARGMGGGYWGVVGVEGCATVVW